MPTDSRRASAFLLHCLDEPPEDRVPPKRLVEAPGDFAHFVEAVALFQFEGLQGPDTQGWVGGKEQRDLDRETRGSYLDIALCRQLITRVPFMVDRLLSFDRLSVELEASDTVAVYFEQAMRCYVQGLNDAAVALARACMERALKETLRVPHSEALDLEALVSAAGRTRALDDAHLHLARQVQRAANAVLHRQNCTDGQATDAVFGVRAVLVQLYRPSE